MVHSARYWTPAESGALRCQLCPHECLIPEGTAGRCGGRVTLDGALIARTYGLIAACNLDPIEKKPLARFFPGTHILSVGTYGCNLSCSFCQNWEISQSVPADGTMMSPEELVSRAQRSGSLGIAYTYNEPFVWYEFVRDTALQVRRAGMRNVLVTNGYVSPQPLDDLMGLIDAVNIDVKAFTEDFYARMCGARLAPVLETARRCKEAGVHVELTTLLIPGENDSLVEIEALVSWISTNLGADTPLHLSRYFPRYRALIPATPRATLLRAERIAREKLSAVFLGNI